MNTKHQISRAAVWTLLAGIVMTVSQTMGIYQAQLTSQGSTVVTSKADPVVSLSQGPMHAAAPFQEPSGLAHIELLVGMLLIVAGFALTLFLKRSERTVRVHAAPKKVKVIPEEKPNESWFWMKIDI